VKKKVIIITILLLIVLFFPYEIGQTDDGGSTTFYYTLVARVVVYDRPPLGSQTYQEGTIIYLFGKEVFNNVVEKINPNAF